MLFLRFQLHNVLLFDYLHNTNFQKMLVFSYVSLPTDEQQSTSTHH